MASLRYAVPLRGADGWRARYVAGSVRRSSSARAEAFKLTPDEERFARELLERATHLWLFRSNQRLFCGDFVVIDMSCPRPAGRKVVALDIKLGGCLRLGGGPAARQLVNAERAADELADELGIVPPGAEITRLSGDRRVVLPWLRARG